MCLYFYLYFLSFKILLDLQFFNFFNFMKQFFFKFKYIVNYKNMHQLNKLKKCVFYYSFQSKKKFIISNIINYSILFDNNIIDFPVSISCQQIVQKDLRNLYGQFYIGPFFIGQGLTIANALRRTLLSELSSLAITSVQIQDVVHQYQTIQGLQESIFDFLLNIKDVVLKPKSRKGITVPQIGYLQIQGPCVIKAKDLILPPLIQSVDPDQYIGTLSDDGYLNLKCIIRQGKHSLTHIVPGFSSNELNQKLHFDSNSVYLNKDNDLLSLLNKYSKNLIIDAYFNPVIKVNYIIELLDFNPISSLNYNIKNIKINKNKNCESTVTLNNNFNNNDEIDNNLIKKEIIILEIWTNGSISPITALKISIQKLIWFFLKIQKSKILNTILFDSNQFYKKNFEKFNNELNILKFKQCQTLSDLKDSKNRHISEKFLIQKLKYLINQLESF